MSGARWPIELDREVDGRWIAEIPTIPGALAYGETEAEAVQAVIKLADEIEARAN